MSQMAARLQNVAAEEGLHYLLVDGWCVCFFTSEPQAVRRLKTLFSRFIVIHGPTPLANVFFIGIRILAPCSVPRLVTYYATELIPDAFHQVS